MRKKKTARGFAFYEFKDANGTECSLQKSSSIGDRIWIGANKIGVKEFVPFRQPDPWIDKAEFDSSPIGGVQYVANNRMHLSRKQVKALLPHLIRFVETGEL